MNYKIPQNDDFDSIIKIIKENAVYEENDYNYMDLFFKNMNNNDNDINVLKEQNNIYETIHVFQEKKIEKTIAKANNNNIDPNYIFHNFIKCNSVDYKFGINLSSNNLELILPLTIFNNNNDTLKTVSIESMDKNCPYEILNVYNILALNSLTNLTELTVINNGVNLSRYSLIYDYYYCVLNFLKKIRKLSLKNNYNNYDYSNHNYYHKPNECIYYLPLVLPELEELTMENVIYNCILNVDLSEAPKLSFLNLSKNKIKFINIIYNKNCKLKSLLLDSNLIRSLLSLKLPNTIKYLSLKSNILISTIDGLDNLPNSLNILDLSHNNITHIDQISIEKTNLIKLDLSSNLLNSVSGIEYFPNLEELNIENNKLHRISELSKLLKIKKINMYENFIDKMFQISLMSEINELKLSLFWSQNNSFIQFVESLNNLTKLTKLKIKFCIDKSILLIPFINQNTIHKLKLKIPQLSKLELDFEYRETIDILLILDLDFPKVREIIFSSLCIRSQILNDNIINIILLSCPNLEAVNYICNDNNNNDNDNNDNDNDNDNINNNLCKYCNNHNNIKFENKIKENLTKIKLRKFMMGTMTNKRCNSLVRMLPIDVLNIIIKKIVN
jgi:hypothetical protein